MHFDIALRSVFEFPFYGFRMVYAIRYFLSILYVSFVVDAFLFVTNLHIVK